MPTEPTKKQIENIVQHFLWRADVFEEPSSERPNPADTAQLIRQLGAAALEQAAHGFAFSPDSTEWLNSLSRMLYSALEQMRRTPGSEESQKSVMSAINCLEAFREIQKLLRDGH
jgi:hypothetical protein